MPNLTVLVLFNSFYFSVNLSGISDHTLLLYSNYRLGAGASQVEAHSTYMALSPAGGQLLQHKHSTSQHETYSCTVIICELCIWILCFGSLLQQILLIVTTRVCIIPG